MRSVARDHHTLNQFHEQVIYQVVQMAQVRMESEWGKPPAHFAFFVMGSTARFEQSVWSDQDHGLIYEDGAEPSYFLTLGEEISRGLEQAGYARCDGKVMASNRLWCKSQHEWHEQLERWLDERSWETIRHFLTFFDSRVVCGEEDYLDQLKDGLFSYIDKHPAVLKRLIENTSHIKKAVGVFGQFLVETSGKYSGCLRLKETAFFPYVNALRLLAIYEQVTETSTLTRFTILAKKHQKVAPYERDFKNLLALRLRFQANQTDYDSVHYLDMKKLSRADKKQLKAIIKHGRKLFMNAKEIVEKGC
ncbi:hypothetical protein KH400_04360 [Desertibacillus haloalkaliphilus]|nr:hypothetical protein [Desertibacillus haloalkaliphilus]